MTSLGLAGVASSAAGDATASAERPPQRDPHAVLVDITACVGCRKCEWACNQANGLPAQPLASFEDKSVFGELRRPDAGHYTVVDRLPGREGGGAPRYVKVQCMHCEDPACVSACLVSALEKQPDGAVSYAPWRCMGCRYCMVVCPFQVPAYEYANAFAPRVRKCTFCDERVSREGKVPACVAICPPECLTFGRRDDILDLAHRRIREEPAKYVNRVYGEEEVGGTSWLYLSDVPFSQVGLPALGAEAPSRLTEGIQHGVFKGAFPPLALFALLAGVRYLSRPEGEVRREGSGDRAHGHPAARVKARLLTPGVVALVVFMVAGAGVALARFLLGLGAITHLDDRFPWGIWIAIDVATGVALAAGGFTTAALVHVFHRRRYGPITRSALLTAMLGYTFVVLGILVDLGRYYNIWHPAVPAMWSGHSALFEVAMCVMAYLTVLYIEFLPVLVERFAGRIDLPGRLSGLNGFADGLLRRLDRGLGRVMTVFIILGVVLSTLHQSSLGTLMLLAPSKMNPLWWTPILPLLFFLSAVSVGFPMVIVESMIAARAFRRRIEMDVLAPLAAIIPALLFVYLAFKIGDLANRGVASHLLDGSVASLMLLLEVGLGVVVPLVALLPSRARRNPVLLFSAASLVVIGVGLNRVNVFLTAFTPAYAVRQYFPSIGEIAVTVGLIAGLVFAYRMLVTLLPVLPAEEDVPERRGGLAALGGVGAGRRT